MFDIKLEFDNINIFSIEKQDIKLIYKWIRWNNQYLRNEDNINITYNEFYEHFLEYYFSECEFFLKIIKKNRLIGIFKGRTEFKNPNEVWIKYFLIDKDYRNYGLGSRILNEILKYFSNDCGIFNFYTKIKYDENNYTKFLLKNNFYILNSFNEFDIKNTILKKRMIKT
ncbi:GNAT family N-acetyltransferase [Clostridium botulinum C]|uniref:GNAT family N-acetyltransferase n=2 Tax=Clostridium botulinum TaxID=1491 RepID=A0A9Q4TNR3_CLOBO|nr:MULTISPECIES: GNAT family N-acetyltransferase [Clostridium]EGO87574.2 GNAT family acetyltransferase [Clostridium botulinum C str. Stockholm]KEI06554.1 GNAT family acetyltransferase [Clostridium sp. K25]MCD3193852.1 GNAT family N-acetyltransferase [Clostridium botulinum C]MCD3199920.1 GNAT family N-acetyltransferase [Clostridium botulinum C]MCD3205395.1 GNAT family N-acetyltransferase [Clostridium botulinum C]